MMTSGIKFSLLGFNILLLLWLMKKYFFYYTLLHFYYCILGNWYCHFQFVCLFVCSCNIFLISRLDVVLLLLKFVISLPENLHTMLHRYESFCCCWYLLLILLYVRFSLCLVVSKYDIFVGTTWSIWTGKTDSSWTQQKCTARDWEA